MVNFTSSPANCSRDNDSYNMTSIKHIVNDPRALVNESLQGLARLNPKIKVDEASRVVHRNEVPKKQVALVGHYYCPQNQSLTCPKKLSGGGSGHEVSSCTAGE